MTLSLNALAELLDLLADNHGVLINEAPACVVASELDATGARRLANAVRRLQWHYQLVDSDSNAFTVGTVNDDFAPFRLTLHKQMPRDDGALYLLSTTGFTDMLARGHPAEQWRLARLGRVLITQGRAYGNWDEPLSFNKATSTRSPRALVRETAMNRRVPEDIRYWLLDEHCPLDLNDPLHAVWACKAFDALTRSLANEVETQNGPLIFRGPPTLALNGGDSLAQDMHTLGVEAFTQLQSAARWVYELSREAPLRHAMLSTEIARSGRDACAPANYFAEHLANALDGAKAVYQLHVSDLTVDTLNALTSLRGNVCDDAARTTEATQQALTKVAAALGVGLTVIATGIGSDISPWLVLFAMLVACIYCSIEVWAGWRLIQVRRSARDAWHPRLYRFLPSADYTKMVTKPAQHSERVYLCGTVVGLLLLVGLSVVVVIYSFTTDSSAHEGASPAPGVETEARQPTVPGIEFPPYVWLARE